MNKEFPYKKILVIDDNETDFYIAHGHINSYTRDVNLFYAMDVDSGLEMFRSFKQELRPDLILLDLNFDRQGKQGIDFLIEFQKMEEESVMPTGVIILSAFSVYNEVQVLRKIHPVLKFIEKPFSVEKILS